MTAAFVPSASRSRSGLVALLTCGLLCGSGCGEASPDLDESEYTILKSQEREIDLAGGFALGTDTASDRDSGAERQTAAVGRGTPEVSKPLASTPIPLGDDRLAVDPPSAVRVRLASASRAASAPRPLAWPAREDAPRREWTSIVLHHSATTRGSVESIHEAHVARQWLGIGYHFVIGNGDGMPDGRIEPTFRWRDQLHGAHAGNNAFNQHGVGVCLIGDFTKHRPTDRQLASVTKLVSELSRDHNIPRSRVVAHADVKATACPGGFFPTKTVRHAALPDDSEAVRRSAAVPAPNPTHDPSQALDRLPADRPPIRRRRIERRTEKGLLP